MIPGQAPIPMSEVSIAVKSLGLGVVLMEPEWIHWAISAIEPIEDET